jgi:hypothetical protein
MRWTFARKCVMSVSTHSKSLILTLNQATCELPFKSPFSHHIRLFPATIFFSRIRLKSSSLLVLFISKLLFLYSLFLNQQPRNGTWKHIYLCRKFAKRLPLSWSGGHLFQVWSYQEHRHQGSTWPAIRFYRIRWPKVCIIEIGNMIILTRIIVMWSVCNQNTFNFRSNGLERQGRFDERDY